MTEYDMKLSRRATLQGMAGLVIGMTLPLGGSHAATAASKTAPFVPNAFVRVAPDSSVTVIVKHIEFGQGPYTGLTTLVAEEMDADWAQMKAESAPAIQEIYKNLRLGSQGTGGSSAIANSYDQMRRAGATARAMLVSAAADAWKVPAAEITITKGILSHAARKKSAPFGTFVAAAAKLPVPETVTLKDPSQFRLIGKDSAVKRIDTPSKVNGTAQFGLDVFEPGLLTVVVAHSPRFGGSVKSFDATEARKVKGVVDVKQIPEGVAVYATGTWPAIKGREALKITWDDSNAETRGSEELIAEYRKLAQTQGAVAGTKGDAAAALKNTPKIIEREYVLPYLAHAPMEPLDGVLIWDGKTAHARYGCQGQTSDQTAIAKTLGLPKESVTIDTLLAGGSFGRRSQLTSHFAVEMCHVAQAIGAGKPIKLVWTREDDIQGGYYRPLFVHRMRGTIKDGKVQAWSSTSVGQSILKDPRYAASFKNGVDPTSLEGMSELLYDIPNFSAELHSPDVKVPISWWRSVGHSHTGYAAECFIDELLEAAGQDPVQGRLALMTDNPRAAGVLRAVAELAKWTGPAAADGRARGVAVVKSFKSYVAQIAEVSKGEDGPRVHKIWCAVDCGQPVNPDIIRAQMEGGIGFGMGHALYGEITLKDGHPEQSNFDTYRSLRINEMPEIEVVVLPSSEAPTGVGEPGVPPAAPAVANAMARLGLGRPSRLPFLRQT
ncbi:xanthine dehydrogenase family protein molybdopterin-binding subunit [Govanella unica]|uniref:Xanthine dehydrogenase family protein molybdopterin-binding subunit n=1 Tax=Govanella unica TaxID=2975056 RepID=A0A9X3Z6U7_9PROT|nr:xanthine dehydrogenase family protein molybdopterin-binding subunit [Govania unica]MDA5193309.1 xanthine dehydrogenase family protein molybdopterin-binding subunit [Govania unica]